VIWLRAKTDFFNAEIPVRRTDLAEEINSVRLYVNSSAKLFSRYCKPTIGTEKQSARALSISYRALLYKIRDAGLPSNRSVRRGTAENVENPRVAAD